MSNAVQFTVPGRPKTCERPRFGSGTVYKNRTSKASQGSIARIAADAMRGHTLFDSPVALMVNAIFARPKRGKKGQRHYHGAPDLDNIIKNVMDACNKVVWVDDRFVVTAYGTKIYGAEEGIQVRIEKVEAALA